MSNERALLPALRRVRHRLVTISTLAMLLGLLALGGPTLCAANGASAAGSADAAETTNTADTATDRGEWLVDQRDDATDPDHPLPAFLDLRRLRVRTEPLAWGGRPPREVVVIVVNTATGPDAYPERTTVQVHLAFGRQPNSLSKTQPLRPDTTLTLRMTEGRAAGGRRRAPAGDRARAVARFDGAAGLGSLSSLDSGHSVTFRVPLDTLWQRATSEQQHAAADGEGRWSLRVWATTDGPEGYDILPAEHCTADGRSPAGGLPLLLPVPKF